MPVSILLWNVWNLPSWLTDNKSKSRATLISPLLRDFDIVVLNEAFVNHTSLLHATSHERYVPGRVWYHIFSSGVMILSKYEIIESEYQVYQHRQGVDWFTGKGIVRVRVRVDETLLDVLGTHMQASNSGGAQMARAAQAEQLGQYIRCLESSTIVLAGDLNMGPNPSQHYSDDQDETARVKSYNHLRNTSGLFEITPGTARDEYDRDICRFLVSPELADRHTFEYPFPDNSLSDTAAMCLKLEI